MTGQARIHLSMGASAWQGTGDTWPLEQLPSLAPLELWADLDADTVLLAPNLRLPSLLTEDYARWLAERGQTVWDALPARSWGPWWREQAEQAELAGRWSLPEGWRHRLSTPQAAALWEQLLAQDPAWEASGRLLNGRGVAALAQEADELVRLWGLRVPADRATPEWLALQRWRRDYARRCSAQGWYDGTDEALAWLDGVQGGSWPLPRRVVLAGFVECTPLERAMLDSLQERGVLLQRLLPHDQPAQRSRVAVPDLTQELRLAVHWAVAHADEQQRVALVVTDLAERRAAVERELRAALQTQGLKRRWNISLGHSLADGALVRTALDVLQLLAGRGELDQTLLLRLLRTPYLADWSQEYAARGELEASLREKRRLRWPLEQALAQAGSVPLQGWIDGLRGAWAASRDQGAALPSVWATRITEWLSAADWPGARPLSPLDRQAMLSWQGALQELASLDLVLGSIKLSAALAQLRARCAERIFQPESPRDPHIEVLGVLEAVGGRWDHMWLLGVSDEAWPPPPRPNPLVPATVQRAAGVPHSSAEREFFYAHRTLDLLTRQSATFIASAARVDGDLQLQPSTLLEGWPCSDPTTLWPAGPALPLPHPAQSDLAAWPLELLDDHRGPALPDGQLIQRGGAALLAAQAKCPLWGFAVYRLGARPLGVAEDGVDALERGTLLHRALEYFWTQTVTQAALLALDPAAKEQRVQDSVERALRDQEDAEHGPFPRAFRVLEATRLQNLVLAWLEVEADRPPFRVLAHEKRKDALLGGLQLRITLDRVDQVSEEGTGLEPDADDAAGGDERLILDYKTGEVRVKGWLQERLTEPQLPLYAIQPEYRPMLTGVAFARVKRGALGFEGLSRVPGLMDGVKAFQPVATLPDVADWSGLLAHWERALLQVAQEFRQGDASLCLHVKPPELAYCPVKPLLRLAEWSLEDLASDDDATEEDLS